MTDSVSTRPCVTMSGTCTGTSYGRSNHNSIARMENTSTGGRMDTRDSVSTSGGKTRQNGDEIWNTAPAAGGTMGWVRAGGVAKTFGAIEA